MRLTRLTVRSFRNLADGTLEIPEPGLVLLGPNGQGKTSFLEAAAYPVPFRSFRTSHDGELVRFGENGIHVAVEFSRAGNVHSLGATFRAGRRKKELTADGAPVDRIVDVAGRWAAVVFTAEDVRLAAGPAAGRRLHMARTLALSAPKISMFLRASSRCSFLSDFLCWDSNSEHYTQSKKDY